LVLVGFDAVDLRGYVYPLVLGDVGRGVDVLILSYVVCDIEKI
jgi:hypothetical protein